MVRETRLGLQIGAGSGSETAAGIQARKDESKFYADASFYSADAIREYIEQAGFGDITAVQTIFQSPAEMDCLDDVRDGTGEGSFIVMRGMKC